MNIAKTIDHTLLKPEATAADIQALCREAKQYGFASVCVNTCYVKLASELLRGSGVKVCCTVGFPLGAMAPKAKAFEAAQAVADGAEEVDMVLWIGALRQGNTAAVQADIEGVVNACHPRAIVKVILETCLLTDAQIDEIDIPGFCHGFGDLQRVAVVIGKIADCGFHRSDSSLNVQPKSL